MDHKKPTLLIWGLTTTQTRTKVSLLSKALTTFCTDIKGMCGLWGEDFGGELSEPRAITFSNVGTKLIAGQGAPSALQGGNGEGNGRTLLNNTWSKQEALVMDEDTLRWYQWGNLYAALPAAASFVWSLFTHLGPGPKGINGESC